MFNLGEREETLSLPLSDTKSVRDLWAKRELGLFTDEITLSIPAHGVRLLRLRQEGKSRP